MPRRTPWATLAVQIGELRHKHVESRLLESGRRRSAMVPWSQSVPFIKGG